KAPREVRHGRALAAVGSALDEQEQHVLLRGQPLLSSELLAATRECPERGAEIRGGAVDLVSGLADVGYFRQCPTAASSSSFGCASHSRTAFFCGRRTSASPMFLPANRW